MGVVYDEVFISTMKEINVCKNEIRKLSKVAYDMETKYNLSTVEFMERFNSGTMGEGKDYREWYDSYAGLKGWEQRLKEFQEILENAAKTT